MNVDIDLLRNVYLFSKVSDENLKKLKSISNIRNFKKGEIVFHEGDKPENIYILLDGLVKVYKLTNKGTEVVITQFKPVSIIGEMANFENISYPATAEFITEGQVLQIDFEAFKREFMTSPEILLSIIKSLLMKIRTLDLFITTNMVMSAEERVAKIIMESPEIFTSLKHSQIASLLNIAPETLSRIISKFKQNGAIHVDEKHRIVVKDIAKLKDVIYNF
ncbi:transcriptional regulator, Crp/Fnr family [Hydrogenobaculum sp. Y04AAS1]|uniref:cyclic nucleotide-binding domain-containing protein n=1 Tax=Hydrogenobaculum sp. (strain Y04AAS1) TaxID=380749 RepID=UPI00015BC926|nr:transcriptional regulator, Crp/Fnr family [Hydrogenobaculum sp. Y04AAS1]HCT66562.1 Crp/Fnr family transcriptional regulator [Hydrogenobaculum sp.]